LPPLVALVLRVASPPRLAVASGDDAAESGSLIQDIAQIEELPEDTTVLRIEAGGKGLQSLAKLAGLHTLTLKGEKIQDGDVGLAAAATGVEELHLIECRSLGDAALAGLAKFQKLARLRIRDVPGMGDAAGMAHLGQLAKLQSLDLEGVGLGDAGMEHLGKLTQLSSLRISRERSVTAAGLAHLGRLTRLKSLTLHRMAFADAGLTHVSGLKALSDVCLEQCRSITDAGLEHLAGLSALQDLDVSRTHITGAGIARLGDPGRLRRVTLQGCDGLTADGLKAIAGLKALKHLDLSYSDALTDASADALARISGLEELDLRNAVHMSTDAVKKVAQALPACKVRSGPGPVKCRFGMYVLQISNIDTKQGTFWADFYLWLVHPAIGPATPLPTALEGDRNLNAGKPPDLTKIDLLNTARVDHKTEVARYEDEEEDVTNYTLYRIQAVFNNDFDLKAYPFDS
jgi:hypothetical protein